MESHRFNLHILITDDLENLEMGLLFLPLFQWRPVFLLHIFFFYSIDWLRELKMSSCFVFFPSCCCLSWSWFPHHSYKLGISTRGHILSDWHWVPMLAVLPLHCKIVNQIFGWRFHPFTFSWISYFVRCYEIVIFSTFFFSLYLSVGCLV